jgi:hypothetical protein
VIIFRLHDTRDKRSCARLGALSGEGVSAPTRIGRQEQPQENRRGGPPSDRRRFDKNLCSKAERQVFRRQQIDFNAEQFLKLGLQAAKIEQGGAGECVDQDIEITLVIVRAMQRRSQRVVGSPPCCGLRRPERRRA